MVYDWVQGSTFHYLALKNIDLEANFHTEEFPVYAFHKNCKYLGQTYAALYGVDDHIVKFNERTKFDTMNNFVFVYFHELVHSSAKWNGRNQRMWNHPEKTFEILGLEERIADLGAVVLTSVFHKPLELETIVKLVIKDNRTNYALPWNELESAVKYYLKKDDCSKIENRLLLIKEIILKHNLTTIYEGNYDGRHEIAGYATIGA